LEDKMKQKTINVRGSHLAFLEKKAGEDRRSTNEFIRIHIIEPYCEAMLNTEIKSKGAKT